MRLYNTLGKRLEIFRPARRGEVTAFTCGPSVYQRAHIGNFRTFLFEDILVRYLAYLGFKVKRGMNFTDIEDKAIQEAAKRGIPVQRLTGRNIDEFIREMKLLRMKMPDYLPRASEYVEKSVELILQLIQKGFAYWYRGNVYYDPLKFPLFGEIYGLDMSQWPSKKRRFHKDTYPGVQWNRGDFILWHGYKSGDTCFWDTVIGRGRPSWNIQDPSMVSHFFHKTLSFYCGGIDNLYRHHDYTKAILESVRPYPMAKFWLHCNHLHVDGKKMSKSRGNVIYTDTLQGKGYSMHEIRFFLIYNHYRDRQNYTDKLMSETGEILTRFKQMVRTIRKKAAKNTVTACSTSRVLQRTFEKHMDDDLRVRDAFDGMFALLSGIDIALLAGPDAAGIIKALRDIDEVLQIIF